MMLSFVGWTSNLLSERTEDGDCFPTANRIVMNSLSMPIPHTKPADWKIVHAIVSGQGTLTGKKYVHAFLLYKGMLVSDQSNGNNILMPRPQYYSLGKIDPKQKGAYIEYTIDQATKKLISSGHHGPWDIDSSLEEMLDRIGKKKIKLDSNTRKMLLQK